MKESILKETQEKGIVVDWISDLLMEVQLELKGQYNGDTFVIAYIPTEIAASKQRATLVAHKNIEAKITIFGRIDL